MQIIKNLLIEDSRRDNYIALKGYKATYTNHFKENDGTKYTYTGIEYKKEKGSRNVRILGYRNYYRLVCHEYGRYDLMPIIGLITGYLQSNDLDDLVDTADKFIAGKIDINTNGISNTI